MNLEWEECETSGHLKAEGNKGQYWIIDNAWVYLERVNVDPAGPNVEKLGTFYDVNEATTEADIFDQ